MKMQQTKGAMGNLKKCYLAVLRKCRLLMVFGMLSAVSFLSAGVAQAYTAPTTLTLTNVKEWNDAVIEYLKISEGGTNENPAAINNVIFNGSIANLTLANTFSTSEFTLNNAALDITDSARLDTDDAKVQSGAIVNVKKVYVAGGGTSYVPWATRGFVVDTNLTVGASGTASGAVSGTINTTYLDVQTYTEEDHTGHALLTIEAGGRIDVSGDVNVKKFTNGEDTEIIIKNGGHLRVGGTLSVVNGGKISVDGDNGSIYLENDATLNVNTISSNANASGIVLTNHGQVYGKKRLTLTGGATLAAAGGNVKAAFMTIGNGTGNMEVDGGQLKVYGKEHAGDTTPLDKVLLAGTMSTKGAGTIHLGDATTPTNTAGAGNIGGTTTAKFVTAGTGGLFVEGGTWTVGDVTVGANTSLTVNNATLDVSGSKLTTDAHSTVKTGEKGTLKITSADVTLASDGTTLDASSSIKKAIENRGVLEVAGDISSITNSTTYKNYINALTGNGSTGAISLKDKDMRSIVGNSALPNVSSDFKGLDLTGNNVKAGAATDTLTNITYVGSVDASSVSGGTYAVAGSTLVLAGNSDATQVLIKTAAPTDTIKVAKLQLGMVEKNASAGKLGALTTSNLTAVNGDYTIDSLTSTSTAIKDGGTVRVKGLLDAKGTVTVGDSSSPHSGGTLIVKEIKLGSNILFADPSWISAGSVHAGSYGSKVAVAEFTGINKNELDGDFYAGQASQMSLGTTDTTILSTLLEKSKAWGTDITAAVYLDAPVKLTIGGAIHVNGATTTAPSAVLNQAVFANKSLLAVNAKNLGSAAAITAANTSTTATIDAGAKLHLTNARNGQEYTIMDGFSSSKISYASGGWQGVGNLLQKINILNAGSIGADGKVVVSVDGQPVATALPRLDAGLGNILNEMMVKGLNDDASANAGIRFMSRAIDGRLTVDQANSTIEGAARLSAAAATQGVTMSAVTAGTGATLARTSMASPLQAQKPQVMAANGALADTGLNAGDSQKGFGLWIMPLYQSNNAWGMKAGEFKTGYTSDLGGVAIGADYTINDMLRFGLSFNLGGGYAQSHGDFNKTDNSFNFWGVNAYGGWAHNNFGLIADIGYTSNYNKVKQELPTSMEMADIKSDITSSAIVAGLRGEYMFSTNLVDIIPHVSVRYTGLKTGSYDAKSGAIMFSTEESFQNIWTFPIGVTLSKELESSSGWVFRPQVDLQITPAAGDVKAKNKVRIPSLDSTADLSTRIMDDFSYGGGVGFDIKKGDVSFGLNYTIQASEHSTAHGVAGTLRYEF